MVYPLTSPGTSVTLTDVTSNASAGEGTIPLIIVGTHEYKTTPSGSGIAEGTLPANANKLYQITSQRELLQTFGNPVFYTKNGTATHGYELNEYGLHAAYQYLGIANRAYVVRGAIDYAQLMPRATEPRVEAAAGTNWLDTQNNTWGIYEYTGSEWAERDLWIVDKLSDLETDATKVTASNAISGQKPPLLPMSVDGDFAMVVVYATKSLYQKISGAWYLVGGTGWTTAKAALNSNSPSLLYNTFRGVGDLGDVLVLHTPQGASSKYAASWLLKTFNGITGTWDETKIPVYSTSSEAQLAPVEGSVFLSHSDTLATFTFRKYSGTSWVNLGETASATAPTRVASDGTLWYNPTIKVDIKINQGGSWVAYRTVKTATDATGVILLGSAPLTQVNGNPLVQDDLWIDTSDLENFPKMYRYASGAWRAIDTDNNLDPNNGIVFGEQATTSALNYSVGMKLFNLTASTNDVKKYDAASGRWINESGFQPNGVPFFGRKAQRQMIVRSLAATISSNEDIRSEAIFFNLIAAPGYIELVDEMVTLNTDMKETAFVVADTPIRLKPTATEISKFANNITDGNSETGVTTANPCVGMYYPWGLGSNVDGLDIMIPPSTMALRTIAYSDSISYQWMAPAGYTRGIVTNATSVGYLDEQGEFRAAMLNEGQRSALYSHNINAIAFIPNKGLVVFGQKTRSALSGAQDRINVARLINYLRYNLDNISKPFLFEPNDFQTREAAKTSFERFLSNLVGLRGLYDFIVVCDESNNTPARIDRQELWIDVAIQPVQTVEFIYIPVRIVNTGDDLGSLI